VAPGRSHNATAGGIANNDIKVDLGECLGRDKGGGADGDGGGDENPFHVSLQNKWCTKHLIVFDQGRKH